MLYGYIHRHSSIFFSFPITTSSTTPHLIQALMDALSNLSGVSPDAEEKCESAASVNKRLQQYQQRWDAVVLQMETQSKKVTLLFLLAFSTYLLTYVPSLLFSPTNYLPYVPSFLFSSTYYLPHVPSLLVSPTNYLPYVPLFSSLQLTPSKKVAHLTHLITSNYACIWKYFIFIF